MTEWESTAPSGRSNPKILTLRTLTGASLSRASSAFGKKLIRKSFGEYYPYLIIILRGADKGAGRWFEKGSLGYLLLPKNNNKVLVSSEILT
jgi:hypothetical protein